MRIDPHSAAQGLPEIEKSVNQSGVSGAKDTSPQTSNAALGEDEAQLSGTHIQAQALTAQALQFPEVRQEKVNALRQVVEDGRYGPGSDRIAEAMLGHMTIEPAA